MHAIAAFSIVVGVSLWLVVVPFLPEPTPQDDLILMRQGQLDQIIENQQRILEAVEGRRAQIETPTPDIEPESTGPAIEDPENRAPEIEDPWMSYVGGWIDQIVNMIILVASIAYGAKKVQERRKRNGNA